MWNAQTDHNFQAPKDERPIALPACFIQFTALETRDLSLGIKNVDVLITFRFAIEHYTFERLSDLDFQDSFDSAIQMFRGNSTDAVQFSSLIEVETDLDEEFDNVNQPSISYKTTWRKISAYTRALDGNPIILKGSYNYGSGSFWRMDSTLKFMDNTLITFDNG